MALAHFRMLIHEYLNKDPYIVPYFMVLNHEFLNKDPDIVPQEIPLIILDSKYDMCMAKSSKDTNDTSNI